MVNLNHNNSFRVLIIALAIMIVSVSAFIGSLYHSQTTDENIFTNLRVKNYISKSISVKRYFEDDSGQRNEIEEKIGVGSILYSINEIVISDSTIYKETLKRYEKSDSVDLRIYDPIRKGNYNCIARLKDIDKNFINYIDSAIIIIQIQKGGASDLAGLKIGDIITSINGEKFANSFEAHRILQKFDSGEKLKYKIIRNNENLTVELQLVRLSISLLTITSWIIGLICMAVALFYGLKRPQVFAARLVSLSFVVWGGIFLLTQSSRISNVTLIDQTVSILFLCILFLGVPLILHSLAYFPFEKKYLTKRKYLIATPYIAGLIFFTISVFSLFFANESNMALVILANSVMNIGLFFYVLYLPILVIAFRKESKLSQRDYIVGYMYLVYGLSVVAVIIINSIYREMNFMFATHFVFLLLILFYLYQTHKYRIFDIDIKIRRKFQYYFITVLFRSLVLFLIILGIYILSHIKWDVPNLHLRGTNIEVLSHPLNSEYQNFYEKIISVVFSFVFAGFSYWTYKKIQSRIDIKFYRTKFDYSKSSSKLSELFNNQSSLSDLVQKLADNISEIMKLKRMGILFFKDESKIIEQKFFGFDDKLLKEFCLVVSDKLVNTSKEFKVPFRIEYLPDSIRTIFNEYQFEYILPIYQKGKIQGLIILGEKRSEFEFSTEDLLFLTSMASQTSTAIENSILYEELAQQERIKHELDIARKIQIASLPQSLPSVLGLDISGLSLPALEVGGDFYDLLTENENSINVIVGDVSGKGTSSALYMTQIQGILRTLFEFTQNPKDLLCKTNKMIYRSIEKSYFITATCCKIDTKNKSFQCVRAGHTPLYVYRVMTNTIEKVQPKGLVLGITSATLFDANLLTYNSYYESGDVFLFVTDGIIEARNSQGEEYQENQLMETFQSLASKSAEDIRNAILHSTESFAEGETQFDDLTIVVVKAL